MTTNIDRTLIRIAIVCLAAMSAMTSHLAAETVTFTLLTEATLVGHLPQTKGTECVSGDHLPQTSDDITGSTYNPDGCLSFNFMNPVGLLEPYYPPGYAENIHSMTGSLTLDLDLADGGAFGVTDLSFDGFVAPGKTIAGQRLVETGDAAADGNHGPIDGLGNTGTYAASAESNWAFQANFDWYYDTPFGGAGSIDMTFDDYQWNGFIIPVSQLTPIGLSATTLDDSLGYFGGASADFESWLLAEIAPRLPHGAEYLLFAQGETSPDWTHPMMGMTTDGIVGQTVIGCFVPEPTTITMLTLAACALLPRRLRRSRSA